jgi:predicted Zn-dependent peptidase
MNKKFMKTTTNGKRLLPLNLFVLLVLAVSLRAQDVPVVEKILTNGMRVLLVERHDAPTVAGGWVAHVGSSNEKPGSTGIAHLFEHMMFKGTTTIGTTDYKKDLEILDEQEHLRDEMRAEEAKMRAAFRRGELKKTVTRVTTNTVISETEPHAVKTVIQTNTIAIDPLLAPENWTPRYLELELTFSNLVVEESKVMVKNEFDKIYRAAGASGMNAWTSQDMTVYFCSVPANKLELWAWMESERLFRPVRREFYSERDVVFEERRMRTDSPPLGLLNEAFNSLFWESFSYRWGPIGWPSDIAAISKKQADDFFATYYAPQNITVVLVGDFVPEQADALVKTYFERIPRGTNAIPDVNTLEMKQPGEKRMLGEADTNPQVDIMWHSVPFGHKDGYALDILAQILSTRTGRLYKNLVLGSSVATDVSAAQGSQKWSGYFEVSGEAREGRKPEEVEQGIYDAIEQLKHTEVPADELQKVKNNFSADQFRRLNSNMSILMELLVNDGAGDWHEVNNYNRKVQAVTAADIKRVANEYFAKENRAVAIYTRKVVGKEEKQ